MSPPLEYADNSDPAVYQKQIVSLQLVTILWMCTETLVAIVAATRSQSVALLGFGADSAIELASAVVVLLRFQIGLRLSEKTAARTTGILLFVLAAFILGSSLLAFTSFRPQPSYLGIALLLAAAITMPWLSHRKRALALRTNSASLKADAVQSSMCAYLAWIALGGLLVNAVFHVSWADPIAAILLLPILLREGWEAIQAKTSCP